MSEKQQPTAQSSKDVLAEAQDEKHDITLAELGISRDEVLIMRGMFAACAEDWDDPIVDIYDELYGHLLKP